MILLLENKNFGCVDSLMGDRYVKSNEIKKILSIDANKFFNHSMSQPLPYDENKFDKTVKLEDNLNAPDDSDIGYFVGVDIRYPLKKGREQKTSHFVRRKILVLKINLVNIWMKLNQINTVKKKL